MWLTKKITNVLESKLYIKIIIYISLWKESLNSNGHQFHEYQQNDVTALY